MLLTLFSVPLETWELGPDWVAENGEPRCHVALDYCHTLRRELSC
jgi:hypothetical protein